MGGQNDILATAGVDLSAFEAGIAKLTSRLDAVEKAGSKASEGIEKVDKTANKLKNITISQGLLTGLDRLAHGGGIASSSISSLGKTMSLTSSRDGAFGLAKGLAAVTDAAAMIPGPVGVIASGIGLITKAVTEEIVANDRMAKKMAHGAFTSQGFLQKEIGLQDEVIEQKNKFFAFTGYNEAKIEKLEKARIANAKQFTSYAKQEVKFTKDTSAGSNQRRAAFDAEAESKQQIADIDAKLHENAKSGTSDAAIDRSLNAQKTIIQAEAESKKKTLALSEAQEKSEVSLNQSASVRGVTMSDAIEAQTSYQTELNAQLKIAQGLFAANSTQVTSLEKALHESKLAVDEINFAQEQNLTTAKGNNEALEKSITGDKSAVASAKEKVAYEIARNQAIKDGNDDLLGQVDIQHDLSTKQIGIDEKNEQVQKTLLGKKQQIGITQQDHLKDLDAELYAAQESLRISNDAGQQGTVINEQLKEAAHQKAKALVLGQLALKDQERQANLTKDAAIQQQSGNQKLTNLAQIRAQYEVQITQAIREGRIEVAKQLTAQKQIAEVEAKIADFQKTPQQRAQDLKEQQKHDQAQGTIISRQNDREARARELGGITEKEKKSLEDLKHGQTIGKSAKEIRDMAKVQGVSEAPMTPEEIDNILGRSDSTNRTSKSREKQLGDFLEEHAPAPADIAKIQKQDVAQMDVQKINLAMLQNAP